MDGLKPEMKRQLDDVNSVFFKEELMTLMAMSAAHCRDNHKDSDSIPSKATNVKIILGTMCECDQECFTVVFMVLMEFLHKYYLDNPSLINDLIEMAELQRKGGA